MGISLGGVNMIDRRVGDEKIQKVILNGAEIWPNERTNINFHIVDNFTGGGGYPGGWSGGGGSAFIGGDGIFSGGGQAYFDYSGFPDLSRAIRVKVVYQVYWDTTATDVNNLSGNFYYGNNQRVELGSYLGNSFDGEKYVLWVTQGVSGQGREIMNTPEPGNYTFTWDLKLTPIVKYGTTYPGSMSRGISGNDMEEEVNNWHIGNPNHISNLRAANDFKLMLQPGIVVKSVDMYIYNADATPRPTGFHIPRRQEMLYMQTFYRESGISFQSLQHYFHIPFSGYYDHNGIYIPPDDSFYGEEIRFRTTSTRQTSGSFCSMGFNPLGPFEGRGNPSKALHIRLFRDYPVVPDQNNHRICHVNVTNHSNPNYKCQLWWNELEGLISFTSNLVEEYPEAAFWCTIQDKNRGATEVYSERTEVTSANEGLWYQRGNNYGFPSISEVRYVSDPIDVSAYGDGIYYESSNFTCSTPNDGYAWFAPLTTPLREETTFNG